MSSFHKKRRGNGWLFKQLLGYLGYAPGCDLSVFTDEDIGSDVYNGGTQWGSGNCYELMGYEILLGVGYKHLGDKLYIPLGAYVVLDDKLIGAITWSEGVLVWDKNAFDIFCATLKLSGFTPQIL